MSAINHLAEVLVLVFWHKSMKDIPYGYIPGFRQEFPLFLSPDA